MSIHIEASKTDIADKVLLPGDPLRAKFIAENYLTEAKCVNETRGMLAFTGFYNGNKITVMGSGMGQASLAIYVNELIDFYDVKKIIRVGTCGSYQEKVKIRDIVLAQSSSTDSAHNKMTFQGMDFAPCADFRLLLNAYQAATSMGEIPHVGNVLATDTFYPYLPNENWKKWANFGVLAVEMESNALYTLCAKNKVQALSVLTVSDSLVTHESTSKEERQTTFKKMVEIAILAIIDP
jgi:purine-nucleoside phosphorylase